METTDQIQKVKVIFRVEKCFDVCDNFMSLDNLMSFDPLASHDERHFMALIDLISLSTYNS